MNKKAFIPLIIILLLILSSSYRWYIARKSLSQVELSGFVECTEVIVRSQVSGLVKSVDVKEGEYVNIGQNLISIDREKQELELKASKAELESLEIDLARAVRELEVFREQVERNISKAKASLDIANYQLKELSNGYPAEDVASGKQAMNLAEDNMKFAETDYERFKKLLEKGVCSVKEFERVEQAYKAAKREFEIRKENYEKLRRGYDEEKVRQAAQNVEIAKISYDDALSGRQQIEIREKSIDSMRKKIDSLRDKIAIGESRLKDYSVVAPIEGVVSEKNIEVGELATIGTPLLKILNPSEKWMRVYIPAIHLDLIRLGDEIPIRFDAFGERQFKGRVSYISQEAEFTPKNVQIKEERVKQVYEVRIDIIESPELVKAGMEGDVILNTKA